MFSALCRLWAVASSTQSWPTQAEHICKLQGWISGRKHRLPALNLNLQTQRFRGIDRHPAALGYASRAQRMDQREIGLLQFLHTAESRHSTRKAWLTHHATDTWNTAGTFERSYACCSPQRCGHRYGLPGARLPVSACQQLKLIRRESLPACTQDLGHQPDTPAFHHHGARPLPSVTLPRCLGVRAEDLDGAGPIIGGILSA